jgi:hypothetical protein
VALVIEMDMYAPEYAYREKRAKFQQKLGRRREITLTLPSGPLMDQTGYRGMARFHLGAMSRTTESITPK